VISFNPACIWSILKLALSGKFIRGEAQGLFIKEFCVFTGIKYALPVQSGRTALFTALSILGLPVGSEVILPAYEDLSVPEVILEIGLTPVFVDVDSHTQNIAFKDVVSKITEKTRVIIVAHIFGNPCAMAEIKDFAQGRGIYIIEDCAHAIGTQVEGKHAGNFGDMSFFSFYTTKTLMCFGSGMVATNDLKLYLRLKEFTKEMDYPNTKEVANRIAMGFFLYFISSRAGFAFLVFPLFVLFDRLGIEDSVLYSRFLKKYSGSSKKFSRIANVQAAIGLENLSNFSKRYYKMEENSLILDVALNNQILRPKIFEGSNHYFYIIFSKRSRLLRKLLLREGLDTGKNLMRCCPDYYGDKGDFSNTRTLLRESVQIPIYDSLSKQAIKNISRIINNAYSLLLSDDSVNNE